MKESGLNKFYKILRIIAITLAIISMVFMLMKKVGLCASSSGGNVSYVPTSSAELPFPLYNFSPIPDSVITSCVEASYSSAWGQYFGGNDWIFVVVEENNSYYHCRVFYCAKIVLSDSWDNFFAGSGHISYDVDGGVEFYLDKTDFSMSDMSYRGSDFSVSFGSIGSANPAGQGKVFVADSVYSNYPCASYNPTWYIDSSSTYGSGDLVFSVPSGHSLGGGEGEITQMPSIDNLTGDPLANDSNPDLFSRLKSWLSTINGTIWQSGKNRENNLTSFFKPYLDRIVSFTDWVFEPFDQEQFENEFIQIPLIGDIYSAKGAIENANLFDFSDVDPAQRVVFTFDFGGAVLTHHTYEINFDWYTGTVKTLITTLIVTFLVIGFVYTVVNQIPSIISGNGGDSGGGAST